MKARLTTWLATLLIVSAVFGVPITRSASTTNRIACYQVYCDERESDREELSAPLRKTPPAASFRAHLPETLSARLLDYSLFQRPPPSSVL